MRILILATFILLYFSCSAQKSLKFTTYQTNYQLELPRGYKLKRLKDDEGYKEYHAIYPDSSVIYITDDNKSGGINKAKQEKNGANVYIQIRASDTLVLDGNHNDGRYWAEHKRGKVVVGYYNVPVEKKSKFDKALATLRRKE